MCAGLLSFLCLTCLMKKGHARPHSLLVHMRLMLRPMRQRSCRSPNISLRVWWGRMCEQAAREGCEGES